MNNTFGHKYNQEPNINEELLYFKETRMKVEQFCKSALQLYGKGLRNSNLDVVLNTLRHGSDYTLRVEKSKWNDVFIIDMFTCLVLKTKDIIMRDIFTFQQHPGWCKVANHPYKSAFGGKCMQCC